MVQVIALVSAGVVHGVALDREAVMGLNERAAKVLGEVIENGVIKWGDGFGILETSFDPEHRIEHAWLLVEKCRKMGFTIDMWSTKRGWSVQLSDEFSWHVVAESTAAEAITAICVEALEAVNANDTDI